MELLYKSILGISSFVICLNLPVFAMEGDEGRDERVIRVSPPSPVAGSADDDADFTGQLDALKRQFREFTERWRLGENGEHASIRSREIVSSMHMLDEGVTGEDDIVTSTIFQSFQDLFFLHRLSQRKEEDAEEPEESSMVQQRQEKDIEEVGERLLRSHLVWNSMWPYTWTLYRYENRVRSMQPDNPIRQMWERLTQELEKRTEEFSGENHRTAEIFKEEKAEGERRYAALEAQFYAEFEQAHDRLLTLSRSETHHVDMATAQAMVAVTNLSSAANIGTQDIYDAELLGLAAEQRGQVRNLKLRLGREELKGLSIEKGEDRLLAEQVRYSVQSIINYMHRKLELLEKRAQWLEDFKRRCQELEHQVQRELFSSEEPKPLV